MTNNANSWLFPNDFGGQYQPGRRYDYVTKARVASTYFNLMVDLFPHKPTIQQVAEFSYVGKTYARKVMLEVDTLDRPRARSVCTTYK